MTCPLIDLAVCFHSIDQLRTTILYRNSVTVIMPHMCEEVDSIRVVLDRSVLQNAKCVKLMTKSTLANDKLCCVRPVEAVDTVRPSHAVLRRHGACLTVAVLE